jgi:hypothetical protein
MIVKRRTRNYVYVYIRFYKAGTISKKAIDMLAVCKGNVQSVSVLTRVRTSLVKAVPVSPEPIGPPVIPVCRCDRLKVFFKVVIVGLFLGKDYINCHLVGRSIPQRA